MDVTNQIVDCDEGIMMVVISGVVQLEVSPKVRVWSRERCDLNSTSDCLECFYGLLNTLCSFRESWAGDLPVLSHRFGDSGREQAQ